jgi:hypothetical protein
VSFGPASRSSTEDYLAYVRLAGRLIKKASADEVAEGAQLLALHIGYYLEKYGDVPQQILPQMVKMERLDEETKRLFVHGMQNLVSALGDVMRLHDAGEEDAVH